MREVEGKVAFITGGGSGVGLGMAGAFLDAGMKVVVADVHEGHLSQAREELAGAGDRLLALSVDVSDREALASAADEAERVFGAVHVVCNNAAVNLFNDMVEATYQDWDWVMGVNLGGVINGVHTFAPRMIAHGEGGHIVNTASMAAFISGPSAGIYTTAKFAVRGLSEALRWSLLPHGIGSVRVVPGAPGHQHLPQRGDAARALLDRHHSAQPRDHERPAGGPAPGHGAAGGGREGAARDPPGRLLHLQPPGVP